jgi:hypothetical protein
MESSSMIKLEVQSSYQEQEQSRQAKTSTKLVSSSQLMARVPFSPTSTSLASKKSNT